MMLHGFSQTGACFDELAEAMAVRALAPDLPGHGPSPQGPVTLDSAVHQVAEVMKPLERPAPLLGYSQGGRIALQVALEHPELVRCLVLLSSSAGIEDEAERAARRATDEARAVAIERDGVSVFLDAWSAMALFSGLAQRDEAWRARAPARRMPHPARGLAAVPTVRSLEFSRYSRRLCGADPMKCTVYVRPSAAIGLKDINLFWQVYPEHHP